MKIVTKMEAMWIVGCFESEVHGSPQSDYFLPGLSLSVIQNLNIIFATMITPQTAE